MHPCVFDTKFITEVTPEGEKRVGICLGNASSSEHENGIAWLADRFGMSEYPELMPDMVSASTITTLPESRLGYYEYDDGVRYLMCVFEVTNAMLQERATRRHVFDRGFDLQPHTKYTGSDERLRATWSSTEFGIRATDDDDFLKRMHEAFLALDIVMVERTTTLEGIQGGLAIIVKSLATPKFIEDYIAGWK